MVDGCPRSAPARRRSVASRVDLRLAARRADEGRRIRLPRGRSDMVLQRRHAVGGLLRSGSAWLTPHRIAILGHRPSPSAAGAGRGRYPGMAAAAVSSRRPAGGDPRSGHVVVRAGAAAQAARRLVSRAPPQRRPVDAGAAPAPPPPSPPPLPPLRPTVAPGGRSSVPGGARSIRASSTSHRVRRAIQHVAGHRAPVQQHQVAGAGRARSRRPARPHRLTRGPGARRRAAGHGNRAHSLVNKGSGRPTGRCPRLSCQGTATPAAGRSVGRRSHAVEAETERPARLRGNRPTGAMRT